MEDNINIRMEGILKLMKTKMNTYLLKCESPIEQLFLLNYFELILDSETAKWFDINSTKENDPFFVYEDNEDFGKFYLTGIRWCEYNHIDCREIIAPREYELYPQFELIDDRTKKKFRLDFALYYPRTDRKGKIKIAIECDGHDFHEKTKEQAQRDKEKDRILQSNGWLVARFTGSEIFKKDVADLIFEIDRMVACKDFELYNESKRGNSHWRYN